MINLKAAIKKLPTLDRRWAFLSDGSAIYWMRRKKIVVLAGHSTIDAYVAAAKTLGYEIEYHSYWKPDWFKKNGRCVGYTASWTKAPAHCNIEGLHKSPAAAIRAAFCAAVAAAVAAKGDHP